MEPTINNEVSGVVQQESFFNKHIAGIIFLINSFQVFFFLSCFIFNTQPSVLSSFASKYFFYLIIPIPSLLLGIFYFKTKRRDIFKGFAYSAISYLVVIGFILFLAAAVSAIAGGH